jgi:PTH1 family peptidyl-tRNA hydrolase
LGNPGAKYERSRHNVGFDVIAGTAAFFQVVLKKRCFRLYREAIGTAGGGPFRLIQPLTYMNNSGEIARFFVDVPVHDRIVVCDNLDLPAGQIRIRRGGSSAGHNGLKSVIDRWGSSDFLRIYVGIGRPSAGRTVVEHVLGRPEDGPEREALEAGIVRATDALIALLDGMTLQEAMVAFNRKTRQ